MKTTAITVGILSILLCAPPVHAQNKTIMPVTRQSVLNASGLLVNGACVWTYLAGTTTPTATYTDQTGNTPSANPIIASGGYFVAYLTPGVSYKFVYESTPCNSGLHGATIYTQDNIAAVPVSVNSASMIGTAAVTLAAGSCAYLSDGSGARVAGQFYLCDSTNAYSSLTIPVIGLVQNAITAGNTGAVTTEGYITGLSSLTVGAAYYASTAGAITSTAPVYARRLGQADTSSTFMVRTDQPTADCKWNIVGKTTSYSANLCDLVEFTSGSSLTLTLPAASTCTATNSRIGLKNDTATVITVARTGGDTIDGASSFLTSGVQYESFDFVCNAAGNGWMIR